MRVMVIGAGGAIGTHLLSHLRAAGHTVIGISRSAATGERLRTLGAEPVTLDVLDAGATRQAIEAAGPYAIIYQATALTGVSDFKHFDRSFAQTNLLRTSGLDHVLAAARAAGVRRVVAQSYANFRYARAGGPVKTEDDALDPKPPAPMRESMAALSRLDRIVTEAGGIALRYGSFYGDPDDALIAVVRARRFPVVGNGEGVWSFIHLHDAAAATVLALGHDGPAVLNIVDDDPAPVRVWLPAVAEVIGAKPPQRVPRPLARLLAGEVPVMMATEARGASNARARRALNWTPRYASWREGFAAMFDGAQHVTAGLGGAKPRPEHG